MKPRRKLQQFLCTLLALLQLISFFPVPARAAENDRLPGDVNLDNVVDSTDLVILSGHVAKIELITDEDALRAADLNQDGIITAADMTLLASMLEEPQNTLSISQVSVNQTTAVAGSIFKWSAEAEGAVGAVEYAFELIDCTVEPAPGQEAPVIAVQDFSSSARFCVRIMDIGDYALSVTCRDESGQTHTLSRQAPVTVVAQDLQILQVACENTGTVYVGDELKWSLHAIGGNLPYTFVYSLTLNGEQIDSVTSGSTSYTYTAAVAGDYSLEVTCTDNAGSTVHAASNTVTVITPPAAPGSAPVLKVQDPTYSLSETSGAAQTIPADKLHFCWEEVAHTVSYEIILEVSNGDAWQEVSCENISGLEYTVSAALISGWDTGSLWRLRATAQGVASSNENVYYFYTNIQDEPILVDGLSSINWKLSTSDPTERTFSVSSLLPWTVTTDSDWISITQRDHEFQAVVSENAGSERGGWIAVTDGTSTVKIRVVQGVGNGAPILVYPAYSDLADAPTSIPTGGMILGFDPNDANFVNIKIYEKAFSGQLTEVYHAVSPAAEDYHPVITDYAFKMNTDYVIELSGSVEQEYEQEAPRNYYYVHMMNQPHVVLVNGQPACSGEDFTNYSVILYTTGAWTYTTDADWLYPESYTDITYKKDYQDVDIVMDPNETLSSRMGTITFICGNETATLTIRQDSCIPRFVKPGDMSQDQNNPSILPSKGFVDHTVYQNGTYARLENGVWSEETSWGSSTSVTEFVTLFPDDYFETDILYRFTLNAGDHTAVYYAKFSDAVTEPYAVVNDGADSIDLDLFFSSDSGETAVDLSTSGAWSIKSDAAWISVSSTSGSAAVSDQEITISVDRNTTGVSRVGTLTIYSENTVCAKINVEQDGVDYLTIFVRDEDKDYVLYDPDTSFKNLDCDKHSAYFVVKASDSYTVTSSSSWITCKSKYITLAANTTGARRTGTFVITCGTVSETITVTQEAQMDAPALVTPTLSTDYKSPSVIKNNDLVLVFNAVDRAVKYKVEVLPADRTLLLPYSQLLSFELEIQADGSDTYSFTIPRSALSVNAESYDDICIVAYDAYGYSSSESYYLKTTNIGAALINGTTAPVWDNATDIATSQAFTVYSTDAWTAVSQASWISLDKTSGSNGDSLTVTLQANAGAARTGQVVIRVGTSETVLTVNQCAWLPEFPSIASPVFSPDRSTPTMIDAGTTSLHVTWNYEPQAEYYIVSIQSFKSNSVQHVEAKSPKLNAGEYTFENLVLEQGKLYCVRISRSSHWGNTAASFYFMLNDENAYVLVEGSETYDCELEGSGDSESIAVTSSGVWTAVSNDEWIMVDNERITQDDLNLQGETTADYSRYSGLSGEDVYISVLSNPTGTFRYGSVTVRCGSAESTINVIQEPYYTTATLYYPQLAAARKESTPLPYGAVSLRWSGASGGTGEYSISLYERDEDVDYRYYEIAQFDNITGTSYTIPRSMLTEGQYYKLWLGTCINGTEDAPGQWYYFRVGYENELLVNVSTDWNTLMTNGFVTVKANATGGAGGYRYSYELLKNGTQAEITELDGWDSYTFNIKESGSYQVRVYVRDSANQGANTLSSAHTVGESDLAKLSLSLSQWEIGTNGGSTTVTVDSNTSWTVFSKPDWIICSASEGTNGSAITLTAASNSSGERSGYVTFSGSGKSASIYVRQDGAALGKPTVIQPTGNVSLTSGAMTVAWSPVSNAGYYILRIRDTVTDTLVIYETDLTTTSVSIPAGYLVSGHSYIVSVGAARQGELPSGSSVSWAEQTFTVSSGEAALCTVSGFVTDSLGNPLSCAVVYAYGIDEDESFRYITQAESNGSGFWSISGLARGVTYAFEAVLSGYSFPPDSIMLTAEAGSYQNLNFQAENNRVPAAITPDTLYFGSDAETDGFSIHLEGSWFAETDVAWIHISAESGTGPAEIEVSVDANAECEARTGYITVTDHNGSSHTVEISQEEAAVEIHVAYGAVTNTTETMIFDSSNEYTGAKLTAGTSTPFGSDSETFVIAQPLEIPAGTTLNIRGDLVIKAKITFCASTSKIACTGNLTVNSGGIIDMSQGGEISVGKNFKFRPKEKHDTELSKGIINVGGNLDIQKNFYASGTNELHLFATGTQHVIDIDDKLFTKNDQHLNILELEDEGVNMLYVKDEFNCNSLSVANWDFLQKALFPVADGRNSSKNDEYGPFLVVVQGFSYDSFSNLTKEKREQIITNIHVGMMRIIADKGDVREELFGTDLTISIDPGTSASYAYKDITGEINTYSIVYNGLSVGDLAVGFGTVSYKEYGGYAGEFVVTATPHDIASAVEEFSDLAVKTAKDEIDEIMKENLSVYNALMKDLMLDVFGDVAPKLEKTINDAEKLKSLIERLTEEKSDLEKFNEIMSKIKVAS